MSKKKINILIVDDDTTLITRLKIALEDKNFAVFTAESHNSAIELLKDSVNNYKLIVVDLALKLDDRAQKSIEYLGTQVIDFAKGRYPHIKVLGMSYVPKAIAKTLTHRIDAFVEKKNDYVTEAVNIIEPLLESRTIHPPMFIGSSTEGLDIAVGIQRNLIGSFESTAWNQDVFTPSDNTLEALIEFFEKIQYAVFVFSPDDITKVRKATYKTARDNVVFELGLAIGILGRKNVFYVIPSNAKSFKLPTDLLGITAGKYEDRVDKNWQAATIDFCTQLKKLLK